MDRKPGGKRALRAQQGRVTLEQQKKLRACLPPLVQCELLEQRVLLSVSGAILAGPYTVVGTTWGYTLTIPDVGSGPEPRTVIGPTTVDGTSVIEIDTVLGGSTDKRYVKQDASGNYVTIEDDDVSASLEVDDAYSPPQIIFPASMTAGVTYEFTTTQTETDIEGGIAIDQPSTENQDITETLVSQSPAAISLPYGTLKAYQINQTETDTTTDDQGNTTVMNSSGTIWCAPGIGIVKVLVDDGSFYALSTFVSTSERLSFAQQPTDTDKGDTIAPVQVSVLKSDGTADPDAVGSITLSLNSVDGEGTLTGTVKADLVNGVATFSDLAVDAGGTYTLSAVDDAIPAVTMAVSDEFNINVSALTWTGGGDGVNWSDPKNWDANVKPVNGDNLIFPGGSPLSPNNDLTGLSLSSIDIQGSGYTLTGNAISLTDNLTSEAGNNTYDIDTTLVGSPEIDDQTGDLTIKSVLSGDGLTLGGTGTVTFDQQDSYTGPTTLKAGITIDDSDLSDVFSTGILTIDAGASPVTFANTSSGMAEIDNEIDFQDGATLDTDPDITLGGKLKLLGKNFLNAIGVNDTAFLDGGSIEGNGTLTLSGLGTVWIKELVDTGTDVVVQSGILNLAANLKASIDDQVAVIGGVVNMIDTLSGPGGIDVVGGALNSAADKILNYTGLVTLEKSGTINDQDSADGAGLGSTSTLDLKGGALNNTSGGNAQVDNPVKIEGNISIDVGGGKFSFSGSFSISSTSQVNATGSNPLQLASVGESAGSSAGMGLIGNAPVALSAVDAAVDLGNDATDVIGGNLGSDGSITVDGKNTLLELGSALFGPLYQAITGGGTIDVKSGILQTMGSGVGGFVGKVILESDGTINYLDAVDDAGLGSAVGATLDLQGGTFNNTSGGDAQVGNAADVEGDLAISSGAGLLDFLGKLNLKQLINFTLSGSKPVEFTSMVSVGGGGGVIGGSVPVNFSDLDAPMDLQNDGTDIIGGILGAAGAITVDSDTTLLLLGSALFGPLFSGVTGPGSIDVKSGTLQTLASGLDSFTGSVILEAKGIINYLDSADGNGLGKGSTLDLQGGTLNNASGADAELDNATTLEGQLEIASNNLLNFAGDVVAKAESQINLTGNKAVEFVKINAGSLINFIGVGPVNLSTVNTVVDLANQATDVIGGELSAAGKIIVDDANTILQTGSAEFGALYNQLSGDGTLDVAKGVLKTLVSGLGGYGGQVILEANGIINYLDSVDGDGLGKGLLDLQGGIINNLAGVDTAILNNVTTLEGDIEIASQNVLAFGGDLSAKIQSQINLTGAKATEFAHIAAGNLIDFIGGAPAIFSAVSSAINLKNQAEDVIGGALDSAAKIVVDDANTILRTGSNLYGALYSQVSGNGTIDIVSGVLKTLVSGVGGYGGQVILEINGIIDYLDTADGDGLGKGLLDLKGGIINNLAAVDTAIINNVTTLEGDVEIASQNILAFGGDLSAKIQSQINLTGAKATEFAHIAAGNLIDFIGGGPAIFSAVSSAITLKNQAEDVIGGVLSDAKIIVDDANTILKTGSTEFGALYSQLSGNGTIDIATGLLKTLASGISGYGGQIILEAKGIIDYLDTADGDGLGTGSLDVQGGTINNNSGADAVFNTLTTLEGDVEIAAANLLTFGGQVAAKIQSTINLTGAKAVEFAQIAAGSLINFTGSAPVNLSAVDSAVDLANDATDVIGGELGSTGEITVDGNNTLLQLGSTLFGPLYQAITGTGKIDVKTGTLETMTTGVGGFLGGVTLESGGTINDLDAIDGAALGAATAVGLDLKGGTFANTSDGDAEIDTPTTLEGDVQIIGGGGGVIGFRGVINVKQDSQLTLNGSQPVEFISFGGGGGGSGVIGGVAPAYFSAVDAPLDLQNDATDIIGGNLGADGEITLDGQNTLLQLGSTLFGPAFTSLAGSGTIDVRSGIVKTNGALTFSGKMILESGGTIKVVDTGAINVLGTGILDLQGGLLQNASSGTASLNNPVTVEGATTVSSRGLRFKLTNNVSVVGGGSLDILGTLALYGSLLGGGPITLDSGEFDVAGANPGFTGNVTVNSGVVVVVSDDALGSGDLVVNLKAAGKLVSASTIGDPVMQNHLVVQAGTLVLDGQFTFPNGVTIDPGAAIEIQGADSKIIVSGPLAGGGSVLIDAGTFSATGDQSGFTGTVTDQTGKFVPTLTVTDAGGPANGSPYPATATITGNGTPAGATLDGITPTLTYYAGDQVIGQGSASAPSAAGTYTVVASFPGDASYTAVESDPVTFDITGVPSKTTPTLTVTDAGGVANGSPFPATISLIGTGGTPTATLDGVSPTVTYYVGDMATGKGTSTPPSAVGTYTVVASFAGSTHYNATQSLPVTFVISPAQTKSVPTITVADAGGTFNGSAFPAKVTLIGTSGIPTATLDGVSPTVTYYLGSTATGLGSLAAPSAAGTYTVVASFAGSANYTAVESDPVTFVITPGQQSTGPTITAPASASVTENGSIVFSASGNDAILVADANGNGKSERLKLVITHGTIHLKSTAGLKFINGSNNSSAMTVVGTLANLNLALNGLTYTPAKNFIGSAPLKVSITDSSGLIASTSVAITVNPPKTAAPQVQLKVFPSPAVRGQSIGIGLNTLTSATLPSGAHVTYHVSFGDGTTSTFVGSLNVFLRHIYTTAGSFTVTVTATNQAGQTSAVVSEQIKVVPVVIEKDPHSSGKTNLFVGGTTGKDTFAFTQVSKNRIAVTVNNIPEGTFSTNGEIIIEGLGGQDVIKADKALRGRIFFG